MTRNRQTEGRALGFLKKTAEHVAKRYQKDFSSENNNWSDSKVAEAAKYALDAGGKRLRPALVIAAALAVGPGDQDEEQIFSSDVISVATAFEYIHTYSLIHDDLPVMDNDAMRRGQPSCHMAFGVETAVKAGVLLLVRAFDLVQTATVENKNEILDVLREAAGVAGMVGGQALDILSEDREPNVEELVLIHTGKTSALIRGSILAGALAVGANDEVTEHLSETGKAAGLAFQIIDDLLDVESTEEAMGKPVGADSGKGKRTYPTVIGIEESRTRAQELTKTARHHLQKVCKADTIFSDLVDFILERVS